MTVLITLTIAGSDTGPFDLYSDVDGFVVPFENNVPKASLVSGYTSSLVPNGTVVIRVKSDSVCTNYIDLIVGATTTTTTSTSTSTSTSTTTTTTTTAVPTEYRVYAYADISLGQNRGDACAGTYPLPSGSPQTVYAASSNPFTVTQFFNSVVGSTLVGPWTNVPTPGDIVSFSTAIDTFTKYTGYVDASGNITSIVAC
jgi:hypothetical protein